MRLMSVQLPVKIANIDELKKSNFKDLFEAGNR